MADEPVISQEAQGSYIAQASHGGIATITVYTSPPSQDDQNRARFLVRLRTRYRELHTQSLHGTIHMILELAGDAGAVAPPI
jgi:hypothetical protein